MIECKGVFNVELIDDEWLMLHHEDGEQWNQRLSRERYPVVIRNGYLHMGNIILEVAQ